MRREDLHTVDRSYSNRNNLYTNEFYNRSGLFPWERQVIERYFGNCSNVLVVAAGGGREVLALEKLGYSVDGFECNPMLADFANHILRNEGRMSTVQPMPHDCFPDRGEKYDGIILGWGAYACIQGKKQRVDFLTNARARLTRGGPVLLSFCCRDKSEKYYVIVTKIANLIRRILRRESCELGDDLGANFSHYFTKEGIKNELQEAGFALAFYSTEGYGHAVGTEL